MGTVEPEQGFFSVLRWRRDVTRDEARNVAVVLVDHDGSSGGIRSAPISSISPQLREQGLLDAMLAGIERQFEDDRKPDLKMLERMHESMHRSLCFTPPQPTAVFDVEQTLSALFRAYVQPPQYGRNLNAKGAILDRTMRVLRKQGLKVHRSHRVGDFFFDVVLESERPAPNVIEVFSFATGKKEPITSEHDAGHFLYALDRLDLQGLAMVQPPGPQASDSVVASFHRVSHWLSEADVASMEPEVFIKQGGISAFHAN